MMKANAFPRVEMAGQCMPSTAYEEKLKIGSYPKPLIVQSLRDHKQSFIVLHGRGSNALKFGPPLLATTVGDTGKALPEIFPCARFVFPTAAPRRAKLYGRKPIFQWMDHLGFGNSPREREVQIAGLQASTTYIHELAQAEIDLVGVDNVILGGLSQGCACMLTSLLTWQGSSLPVAFGMCGWLPFAGLMNEALVHEAHPDDVFDTDKTAEQSPAEVMEAMLYDILDRQVPESKLTFATPIFLGHGELDEKVHISRGELAATTLERLNTGVVHWKRYANVGHWYSSEMLSEIVEFIKSHVEWVCDESVSTNAPTCSKS